MSLFPPRFRVHGPTVLVLLLPWWVAAQVLPADRNFPEAWQQAGVPGPIPAPARIVDVTGFGAAGDGADDDAPAVAAAIASLAGGPGVVYFPAGTYRLDASVQLPSGVVLRGESAATVTLRSTVVGHALSAFRNQTASYQGLVSGYSLHSPAVTVSNAAGIAAGDYVEIREDNDPAWLASDWADHVVGQIVRVASVSSNTLVLDRPLRITYDPALRPELRRIEPVTDVGVESLRIERLLAGSTEQRDNQFTIRFLYAARCWVRGVESHNTFGGHVGAQYSTAVEITGCHFYDAHDHDGGGSGYGVRLESRTGDSRVENNIFQKLRHSMLVQAAANGNVFGYNYSREPTWTSFPSDASSDITLHGNFVYANLFEGNLCESIQVDASHGANGPFNTFVRNRAARYGLRVTDGLVSNLAVVGNETFNGPWAWLIGHGYSLQGGGRVEYGNNTEQYGIVPSGTGDLGDFSYYLGPDPTQAPPLPAFWSISGAPPVAGPPYALDTPKTNPAYARYLAGAPLTVGPPSHVAVTVSVLPPGGGTVSPSGTVWVGRGGGTNFVVQASPYHHVADVRTNGASAGPFGGTSAVDLVWGRLQADAVLEVTFAPDVTSRGTPHAWLALHGLTNAAFEAEDALDSDGDGSDNGDEYVAGTLPTQTGSVFRIVDLSVAASSDEALLRWTSVSNRTYGVRAAGDADAPPEPLAAGLPATPPVNVYTDRFTATGSRRYRISVERDGDVP